MVLHVAQWGYVIETAKFVAHDDAKNLLEDPQVREAHLD